MRYDEVICMQLAIVRTGKATTLHGTCNVIMATIFELATHQDFVSQLTQTVYPHNQIVSLCAHCTWGTLFAIGTAHKMCSKGSAKLGLS